MKLQHFLQQHCIYPGPSIETLSLKVEEIIVCVELHELRWEIAWMCLETNWKTRKRKQLW